MQLRLLPRLSQQCPPMPPLLPGMSRLHQRLPHRSPVILNFRLHPLLPTQIPQLRTVRRHHLRPRLQHLQQPMRNLLHHLRPPATASRPASATSAGPPTTTPPLCSPARLPALNLTLGTPPPWIASMPAPPAAGGNPKLEFALPAALIHILWTRSPPLASSSYKTFKQVPHTNLRQRKDLRQVRPHLPDMHRQPAQSVRALRRWELHGQPPLRHMPAQLVL